MGVANLDRIILQIGWFETESFFVCQDCKNYIRELELYSWNEEKDNEPEDGNDHMVNSVQFAWLPYKDKIKGAGNEDYGAN